MLKTIKYYRKEGRYAWSRVEEYDDYYGTPKKEPRVDYHLGIAISEELKEQFPNLQEGNPYDDFAIRWFARRFLNQPLWGPNGDKRFYELLPETGMKELPPQYIYLPEYFWREYDPENGLAPDEVGEYYELGLQVENGGWRIITVPFDGTLTIFDILKQYNLFTHYRKKKTNLGNVTEINPDYAPAVAVREQERAYMKTLLEETFITTASHVFPGLPLNDILAANLVQKYNLSSTDDIDPDWLWKWMELGEDGVWVSIPIDPNNPLATPGPNSGGWKTFRKILNPNVETSQLTLFWKALLDKGYDHNGKVYTPDEKVKLILGLVV